MINEHLSEEDLQIFAIGQQLQDTEMIQHIESCTSCREQVAVYTLLLTGIKELPAAGFNFDLAAAVLNNIQPIKTRASTNIFNSVVPASLSALLVAISLYVFRKNILNLATGISLSFLLISVFACIGIIGFKVVELYHKYDQQIKKLNFSE